MPTQTGQGNRFGPRRDGPSAARPARRAALQRLLRRLLLSALVYRVRFAATLDAVAHGGVGLQDRRGGGFAADYSGDSPALPQGPHSGSGRQRFLPGGIDGLLRGPVRSVLRVGVGEKLGAG